MAAAPDGAGPDTTFAGVLRTLREAARLTQEDLAYRSGISVRAIRNLELGRTRHPQQTTVDLLVRGLGTDQTAADGLHRLARSRWIRAVDDNAGPPGEKPDLTVRPRQLPIGARHFVGRVVEQQSLDEFAGNDVAAGTSLIAVLSGPAGVGKTGLALRWAHQAHHRFPDGQLYADLGGDDGGPAAESAAPAGVALSGFLRALGIAERAIPDRLHDRAALFRSMIADRRMLVLVDGACCACQVRPLLPASNGCLVLVTSRQPLYGLVAYEGAYQVPVGALTEPEALRLLHALIGDRVSEDPAAARELVRRCRCRPRALRAAAEFAAGDPASPLRRLVGELAAGEVGIAGRGRRYACGHRAGVNPTRGSTPAKSAVSGYDQSAVT